jgi:CheY-like chemotaxis protein
VLQELLHVLGHKGFEAMRRPSVDVARLGTFDLLLMDLHMPGMNGVEAVRALRTASGPESAISGGCRPRPTLSVSVSPTA